MFQRIMGKASFAKLQDRTGQIQIFLQRDTLGEAYEAFKKYDVGDILAATGTLFKTKTGELSVRVEELRMLTKSLRPLPDKWHGMADVDTRYRQRYVDLIVNEQSRNVFVTRTRILQVPARLPRLDGFPRSRDADAADHSGWRGGAAVQDASQRARHGHVPAHRAGAVPQAPDGRRLRARVRDQPQFPQRGRVDAAQPRVHHARAVRRVCRLQRPHRHGGARDAGPGRRRVRQAPVRLPGPRLRPRQAVHAHHGASRRWPRTRRASTWPARATSPIYASCARKAGITFKPATAPASCRSSCSRSSPKTRSWTRPSCTPIPRR